MDGNINIIRFDGNSYYIELGKHKVTIPKKSIILKDKPILAGNIMGRDFALNYSEKSGYYLRRKVNGKKAIYSISINSHGALTSTRILAYTGLKDATILKYNKKYKHKTISSSLVYTSSETFKILEERIYSVDDIDYRVITISRNEAEETIFKVNLVTPDMDRALDYISS